MLLRYYVLVKDKVVYGIVTGFCKGFRSAITVSANNIPKLFAHMFTQEQNCRLRKIIAIAKCIGASFGAKDIVYQSLVQFVQCLTCISNCFF